MSQEESRLKWSEIAKEQRYENLDVSYNAVQEQVYQIAHYYANNSKINIEQNKTYAISDTHGDMGALLESLLRSGTVEFVDSKEPCIVVVNDYNPDHKILIPNLKLKGGCTNKLMICGDIIDRGQHTYSCMMLMKHLMNQQTQQKSNNIIFTVGNHEDMTADGVNRNAYLPLIDTSDIYRGTNKDYNMAKAVILDMVEQDQMVFCYYDENTNTIYSHVPFDMENTQKALKFIQNNKSEFSE
ncbi:MAG: metallophosphoesterase, partial [Rickettsiales bacterium]|nr:metallophosphoesterase [Rickettsiales bacterium]